MEPEPGAAVAEEEEAQGREASRASTASAAYASSSSWPDELAAIFGWDADAGGAPPRPARDLTIVCDGANMAWAFGIALSARFGCKNYPCSAGVLSALDYEARRRRRRRHTPRKRALTARSCRSACEAAPFTRPRSRGRAPGSASRL